MVKVCGSKTSTFCLWPSSVTLKSEALRALMVLPDLSFTVTSTTTSRDPVVNTSGFSSTIGAAGRGAPLVCAPPAGCWACVGGSSKMPKKTALARTKIGRIVPLLKAEPEHRCNRPGRRRRRRQIVGARSYRRPEPGDGDVIQRISGAQTELQLAASLPDAPGPVECGVQGRPDRARDRIHAGVSELSRRRRRESQRIEILPGTALDGKARGLSPSLPARHGQSADI